MINAVIIEDSRLARVELRELLKDFPTVQILGEAENGKEGLTVIKQHKPALIFLDINLPDMTGFEMLDKLSVIPHIIFTTAYDEYAIKSFDYNTLDYLLKPVKVEKLATAIAKVEKQHNTPTKKRIHHQVFIKDGDTCWIIKVAEIEYINSAGNYVEIFFRNTSSILNKSLNQLEEILDPEFFFRTNRQQIINLNYIENVELMFKGKLRVFLKNGASIDVSERQSIELKRKLSF